MPSMTVDLNDPDDLRHAQAVIASRLEALQAERPPADRSEHADAPSADEAAKAARRLWGRVQSPETRAMVRAFVELEQPFSLEDVAEKLGEPYETVKRRKFRFGRTESKLREEFGFELLEKQWVDWRNLYTMDPRMREALARVIDQEA